MHVFIIIFLLFNYFILFFFDTGRLHCLLIPKTPVLHHASGLLWLWDMNSPINGLEILLLWYLIFLSAQIYLSSSCCTLFWLHSISELPRTLWHKNKLSIWPPNPSSNEVTGSGNQRAGPASGWCQAASQGRYQQGPPITLVTPHSLPTDWLLIAGQS